MVGSGVRRVVNAADLSPSGFEFVDFPPGVERLDFSALPGNAIERLVRKPRISRYRAAFEAVRAARGMPIISHLPRMTAAVSTAQSLLRSRSPHLAFSFNFTDLPQGAARRYMSRAFGHVDEFFVFSEYERETYPRYFSLPEDRFTRLTWTQRPPAVSSEPSPFPRDSYVSAVGGEGRDYASLMAAAEALPDIDFVVIARPYNRMGELPSNVRLMTNVSPALTWRIALDSSCMVVPLKSRTTCCGHITLVSGELLGIPLISTASEATREYTQDVALCEPGDVAALTRLIREHHHRVVQFKVAAANRVQEKLADYDRRIWDLEVWKALTDYMPVNSTTLLDDEMVAKRSHASG